MNLLAVSKEAAALEALGKVEILLEAYKLDPENYIIQLHSDTGTVSVGNYSFVVIDNKLRVMGICPVCTLEVASRPLRDLAELADLLHFKPMAHGCRGA